METTKRPEGRARPASEPEAPCASALREMLLEGQAPSESRMEALLDRQATREAGR